MSAAYADTRLTIEPMTSNRDAVHRNAHEYTADHTRRYAATSRGLCFFSSATSLRWRLNDRTRQRGTSRWSSSMASADAISGSLWASSLNEDTACMAVPTSARRALKSVSMPPIMAALTDTAEDGSRGRA